MCGKDRDATTIAKDSTVPKGIILFTKASPMGSTAATFG
ncbi:hypothetical protein APA_468 [Pseudanabaena sp. lw0831]|nr:hypothetical protein APA_468 [Pseudanabaena sp. lw0831]